MESIIFLLLGGAFGGAGGFFYMRSQMFKDRVSHDLILEDGRREAQHMKAEALREVDEVMSEKKEELEKIAQERKTANEEKDDFYYSKQKEIDSKWDLIESKREEVNQRLQGLVKKEEEMRANELDLKDKIHREECRLEDLAGMGADEAKRRFIEKIEEDLAEEAKELIYKSHLKVQEHCEQEAREQLFDVMQRYASECAESRTTSTIYLPNDEIKGRIIGRDGRNIRTIETLTGANVLIDDTPETVVVSCFEPLRREICKKALEHLIEDGRIHPSSITEVVSTVREEIEREMFDEAQNICRELNIPEPSSALLRQLGKLKYRYTAAQSVLHSCKEVASFMGMMAAEFNMDVTAAKLIGLFHAIGKSFDEHTDENFVKTGNAFLKKEGICEKVCDAIALQKQVVTKNAPFAQMLKTAITLSTKRPGARDENMEFYIRRLHQMEHIAKNFSEVSECMVMQAGREIIIHVHPGSADDRRIKSLA
ncbi:MAG: DUF3552 domain-containing protein, partial [Lentisphaeraceae bacterium]|nr:DUF3552 domain-containing protein [Lentisphaeraceae bacterium]